MRNKLFVLLLLFFTPFLTTQALAGACTDITADDATTTISADCTDLDISGDDTTTTINSGVTVSTVDSTTDNALAITGSNTQLLRVKQIFMCNMPLLSNWMIFS